MKRLFVRIILILLLAGIGFWCFISGKAYDIVLENIPLEAGGQTYPSMEAVNAYVDKNSDPILLLDGDRMVATAVGAHHVLRIDVLDEDDKVLDTRFYPFTIDELGESLSLNVPYAFSKGEKH